MIQAGIIATQVLAAAANPLPPLGAEDLSLATEAKLTSVLVRNCPSFANAPMAPFDLVDDYQHSSATDYRYQSASFLLYEPGLDCVPVKAGVFGPGGPLIKHITNSAALRPSYITIPLFPGVRAAVDPASARANDMLREVDKIEVAVPDTVSAAADARSFIQCIPSDVAMPRFATDGESEIVISWRTANKRAVLNFEGDGSFGYALLKGNRFVPGAEEGRATGPFPSDLLAYLHESNRLP